MNRKPANTSGMRSSGDRGATPTVHAGDDDLACLVALVVSSLGKLPPEQRDRLLLLRKVPATGATQDGVVQNAARSRSNILRRLEVQKRTGLTRSTLYDKIANRSFPEQVKLSAGCVGWYECDVEEWLANPR